MNLLFEAINLAKQDDYLDILHQCPQQSSDYSFINLWAWAEEYGLEWAWKDGLVWIRQHIPEEVYWAPVGNWDKIKWPKILPKIFKKQTNFTRIPKKLALIWKKIKHMQGESVRKDWDYLYSVQELIDLKGEPFQQKKNLLNQFITNYDYDYFSIEIQLISHIIGTQGEWSEWRDFEDSYNPIQPTENRAILRVFKAWDQLKGLIGGAIFVHDNMAAYTIAEKFTQDTILIHFEKAAPNYNGNYQAINQLFLNNIDKQFKLVNRKHDLGIEALRKSKLSYNPLDFNEKYQFKFNS